MPDQDTHHQQYNQSTSSRREWIMTAAAGALAATGLCGLFYTGRSPERVEREFGSSVSFIDQQLYTLRASIKHFGLEDGVQHYHIDRPEFESVLNSVLREIVGARSLACEYCRIKEWNLDFSDRYSEEEWLKKALTENNFEPQILSSRELISDNKLAEEFIIVAATFHKPTSGHPILEQVEKLMWLECEINRWLIQKPK